MSELPPRRPKASAGYVWLRIALWLSPGIMAIGLILVLAFSPLLFHAAVFSVGSSIAFVGLTVLAGVFDSALHLTRTRGRHHVRAGLVVGWTFAFVLTQALLVPALLIVTVLGCGIPV